MTNQIIPKKQVAVNIFPDPVLYLAVTIPQIAIETDKEKRLDMAEVMLDALRELPVVENQS